MRYPPLLTYMLAMIVSLAFDTTCRDARAQNPEVAPSEAPAATSSITESRLRDVRVLIARKAKRFRVRADHVIYLVNEDDVRVSSVGADTWHVISHRPSEQARIGSVDRSLPIGLETSPDASLSFSLFAKGKWSEPRHYPGTLELQPNGSGINVINHVGLERYVGCVVGNEVWPTFQTEAYRAQAIVSRSYVLFQMKRRPSALVDVTGTQGSQVYRGLRDDVVGQRAREAASFTRGVILTFPQDGKDDLFCAYFSAACGGLTQSADIFGEEGDVGPLKGGVRCDFCAIAPTGNYRWGPIKMTRRELRDRLTDRYPKIKALGAIRSVEVAEATEHGRALRIRVIGDNRKFEELTAERFRMAVGSTKLKSTDFKIESTEQHVIFKNGRGFGHGLGLCQWGAEGQARQGKRAGQILRHYFPGASLTRVY